MSSAPVLLVGTTKGAFVLTGDAERQEWRLTGPHCSGWPINHLAGDPETGTLWAGGGSEWTGAGVWRSEDGGDTWTLSKLSKGSMDDWAANDPDFAAFIGWTGAEAPFGDTIQSVWSLHYAHGALHAGTKPAQHLISTDHGETWSMDAALAEFPEREAWNGGAAGLVLHTIVSHPREAGKLWLGISAAGVFATEDSGASWERRNRLSNAEACAHHDHPAAPRDGETGHCVHNMMRAPGNGDVLYQQNHHGVYRSHRWRAQLGRRDRGAALDLRLSDPRPSARPRNDLDPAAQRRHAGTLSAGGECGGLEVDGRRTDLGGAAGGAPDRELLLHRPAPGHGGRHAGSGRPLLRDELGIGLRQPRRGRDLGRDRAAPADNPLGRGVREGVIAG